MMTTPEAEQRAAPPPETPASKGGFFTRRRSLKSPQEALQPEAAPPPPPPKKKKRREGSLSTISGFLSFLLLAAVAVGGALIIMQRKVRDPGPLAADKIVVIAKGSVASEISDTLEHEGVIESPLLFNVQLLIEGARSKLKPGEYLFHQGESLRDVIDALVNNRQIFHSVTIPEGLTSEQIVGRLRDIDFLAGEVRDIPKEGSLLPDTYKATRGMGRVELIAKMQSEQKRVLEQIWRRRNPEVPLRSPYELVTLASIVEKETGRADERSRVAGVFVNRLNKRMRLQSDPTIVYGLVGGKGTLGRGILRSELDRWTPYNTYTIDGLPPGPIANPGRAAMEAVANPSRTAELFFVADGTGGHIFAETLDQHSRNVSRWRQLEKDKKSTDPRGGDLDRATPAATSPSPGATPPKPDQRGALDKSDIGVLASLDAPPLPYSEGVTLGFNQALLSVTAPKMPSQDILRELAMLDPAEHEALPVYTPKMGAEIVSLKDHKTAHGGAVGGAEDNHINVADSAKNPAKGPAALGGKQVANNGKVDTSEAFVGNFDQLGIKVAGVDGFDGGDDQEGAQTGEASMQTYPVSAKTLADQKARAARLGLSTIDGPMPPMVASPQAEPPPQVHANVQQPNHPRALDASEGKPFDPLRNKTWDLNSPKTLPTGLLSYR